MITILREGRRAYLEGNTYPYRDQIRESGAHWDAERKMWWTGKRADAERLVADINTTAASEAGGGNKPPETVPTEAHVIRGRASYHGKAYYLLARGVTKEGKPYTRLCFRDGSRIFWAQNPAEVQILRLYDDSKLPSIDGLHAYAKRMQSGDGGEEIGEMCAECGERRAVVLASDSSGIDAGVCQRCASMRRYERSYA